MKIVGYDYPYQGPRKTVFSAYLGNDSDFFIKIVAFGAETIKAANSLKQDSVIFSPFLKNLRSSKLVAFVQAISKRSFVVLIWALRNSS